MTNKDPLDGLDKTFEFRPQFSLSIHHHNILPFPPQIFFYLPILGTCGGLFLKACSLGSLCLNPIWSQTLSWNPSDHDLVLKGRETSRRMGGPPNKKINIFIPFLFSGFPRRRFHYGLFVP